MIWDHFELTHLRVPVAADECSHVSKLTSSFLAAPMASANLMHRTLKSEIRIPLNQNELKCDEMT